ncbi:hypothetical protein AB0368_15855 [Actinoplanes sp. NPDC051475]|uniref:hypothetical protein n=1 Tax=Actinoplanes sp. NPDC051475 TaxID=3157225 RepID=UPI003450E5DD
MIDRALAPGSGQRLRQAYLRYLLIAVVALVLILPLALGIAASAAEGQTVLIAAAGVAGAVVSGALLIAALVKGRAAVAGDVLSVPGTRTSGSLALAAEVVGYAGALAALVLGLVQRLLDIDLALTLGLVMAALSAAPAVISDAARRLSRRLAC